MPRDIRPRCTVSGRRCGAVASRARRDRDAPEIAVIHRPRYDDWSLPKGKVDPGETEPVTAVREILEETGFHAQLGRRLTVGQLSGGAGRQEGRVLGGARAGERRVHAQPRGRQTALAARRRRDEQADLPARPEGVAPVHQTAGRHPHRADRPARHRRAARAATRATTATARWTSTAGHRPSRWSVCCWRSAPPTCTPPTACAATRRSNRWPTSWAVTIRDEPTLTEEAYADNRKRARAAGAGDRRASPAPA